jgi:hypothetical protein
MPLPSISTRQVTERIARIAKRTAQQQNPIVEVTVVRRERDGTLIVSDGRGGCLRQAPRANVRVGQRIKLGTEPSLGTQTNLPLITIDVGSSTTPCPDDPRYPDGCEPMVGVECRPPAVRGAPLTATMFTVGWTDPSPVIPYPGRDGDWRNRLSLTGDLAGGPADGFVTMGLGNYVEQAVVRRCTDYDESPPRRVPGFSPWHDQVQITAVRTFLEFDTFTIPAGETITSVTLRIGLPGNLLIATDHNESIVIVPSTHNGVAETSNWDKVSSVILGKASINDMFDAGPQPPDDYPSGTYNYDVPLDLELVTPYINRAGTSKFAIVMRLDVDPESVLPAPGLFGNDASGNRTTLPSGTPDDTVHVQPGDYQVGPTIYHDVATHDIVISQQDGNGRTLQTGESYLSVLIQPPGDNVAPVLVKGEGSATPRLPPYETGGIVLSRITLGCLQAIGQPEITGDPPARIFDNPVPGGGDATSKRQGVDVIYWYSYSEVQLLIATNGNPDS